MSEFSEAFAATWPDFTKVFGDEITINGIVINATVKVARSTQINPRGAGKVELVSGSLGVLFDDWTAVEGRKGVQITLPDGSVVRAANDPTAGAIGRAVLTVDVTSLV